MSAGGGSTLSYKGCSTPARLQFYHTGLTLLVALLSACPPGDGQPDGGELPAPELVALKPASLTHGSKLIAEGTGFAAGETHALRFKGGTGGRDVDGTVDLDFDSATRLSHKVGSELFDLFGGEGSFTGDVTLEVDRSGQKLTSTLQGISIDLVDKFVPHINSADPTALFFGDAITFSGDGFLFGEEGETKLLLNGTYTPDVGAAQTLADVEMKLAPGDRNAARALHHPATFGLQPGTFTGTVTPVNEPESGAAAEGDPFDLTLDLLLTNISSVSPARASRGQKITIQGGGFLSDDDGGVSTLLRIDGTFSPASGEDSVRVGLNVAPKVASSSEIAIAMRPQISSGGKLQGLGAEPGVVTGTLTPIVLYGAEEIRGQSWHGSLTVTPVRQVVYVKFLPRFTEGLRGYGLRNVEAQVKNRVLEVCRRDYGGLAVEFRDARPQDWLDYTVVEVTDDDPNERNLFGLDNSDGKDQGNLRLNDVIGGRNASAEEQGELAFGGVFINSFHLLSPKNPSKVPLASPRFDDVFSPFIADMGGKEVEAGEYPSGPRAAAITLAIRTLGSLAGNTIVHELGHSLGLAQETDPYGDPFHNTGDTPGYIMNPGGTRSFEERAELDDQGPAVWAPGDRDYLDTVLPLE